MHLEQGGMGILWQPKRKTKFSDSLREVKSERSDKKGRCYMFQWVLPAKNQNNKGKDLTLIYFANSTALEMKGKFQNLPPRLMHAHPDKLEIVFITDGQGHYIIDEQRYNVEKGDVIIIEPNHLHDVQNLSDNFTGGLQMYCCILTGVWIWGMKRNHILPEGASPVLHSGDCEPHIHNILSCIFEQLLLKKQAQALEVVNFLVQALIALVRQIPVEYQSSSEMEESIYRVRHIKSYLDQHYNESCSLDEVAYELNMSISYLSHTFKEIMGYSPGQYMIWRRIGEAQTLLITTEYPVTRIATMVGYDNTNYFSTLFKKTVEMKPKDYRDYWYGKK